MNPTEYMADFLREFARHPVVYGTSTFFVAASTGLGVYSSVRGDFGSAVASFAIAATVALGTFRLMYRGR